MLNPLVTDLVNQPAAQAPAVGAAPQQPSQEVLNAYQTLFGREADMPGALGWTQSGLTGQALLNAMAAGAQGADIQAFENYQKSQIEQNYQNLFGRAPEEQGLQHWLTTTNLIGDDLTNALKAGARGADIGALYKTNDFDISTEISAKEIQDYVNQNINDPYAIYSASQKYKVDPETIAAIMGKSPEETTKFLDQYGLGNLIAQEYKDIGRGFTGQNVIDQPGFNYWYNQLVSGNITKDQFEKAFLTGAMDVVNRGYDADVSSRTIAESIAKGYGGTELIDKANPLDVYEALGREGKTVDSLAQLYPQLSADQISSYLAKVPDAYAQNVDQTITNILGASYASAIPAENKQAIVDKLLTGELTRDKVVEMFANSGANKQQEAERIANAYVTMFGGTTEEAKTLYAKLLGIDYQGAELSNDVLSKARSIYETSLTDEDAGFDSLLRAAAQREGAENTEFFKANPNALLIYDNLEKRSDDPFAKYGEINGAPIYDANAVDKYMAAIGGENADSVSGFAHRDTRRLGIDPGGIIDGGSAFIKRGATVFGLEKVPEYAYDPSSDQQVATGRYTVSGDINDAAAKVGINPAAFQDTYKTVTNTDEYGNTYQTQVLDKTAAEQIYDAINAKTDNLYVIGNVNPDNANDKSENNFMYTAYQRTEDGKLIPVNTPTAYTGAINPDVYKKKGVLGGGFLGDMFQGIASIPGIAELTMLAMNASAPGSGTALYPYLKGAQAAAFTTDLEDIGKAGGMAYLGTQVLPKIGGDLSGYLKDLGITAPIANQAITQGVIGGGVSTLTGGSGSEGLTSGLIGGGIGGTLDTIKPEFVDIAKSLGVDDKFAGVFANTLASLAPTILSGGKIDPTKVLMNYMLRSVFSKKPSQTPEPTTTEDSGARSLMTSSAAESSEGLYPQDVQSWIDEAPTAEGKRYRASIAAQYGLTQEPVSDSEFIPTSRSGTATLPYDPNIAQYMIEQGDNMIARPDENANTTGLGALRQRLGGDYIRI